MNPTLQAKLTQLESETKALFDSIDGLSEDQLHDQSYGWSVIQVLSHLYVAEAGTVIYMTKKMQAGDKMPNFSMGGKLRMALTRTMLRSSLRWKAPKPVSNPKSDYSLDEMKQQWEKSRQKTIAFVEAYPEKYLGKAVFKHPMAGRIDLAGALDSISYHQRHHLHQITRIKNAIGGN